jgi:uncharacterized membrane protein required for colicin V production
VNAFISSLPPPRLNGFDVAALALLLLFAWQGYRRGALGWIAAIGSSLLALAAAFLFAPAVAQAVAGRSAWGQIVAERIIFLVLLIAFRFVIGWVMHELVAAIRSVLWALPPLGLIDRLLGVIPSLALGLILVVITLFAAILLPIDRRVHDAATQSYLGQVSITEVARGSQAIPRGGLLSSPERILDVERALSTIQSLRNLEGSHDIGFRITSTEPRGTPASGP